MAKKKDEFTTDETFWRMMRTVRKHRLVFDSMVGSLQGALTEEIMNRLDIYAEICIDGEDMAWKHFQILNPESAKTMNMRADYIAKKVIKIKE